MTSSSTLPTLLSVFEALEKRLEAEPEGVQGEIARGVYFMSPRPRPGHGQVQGNVFAELRQRFGLRRGGEEPDWLFVIEPEIRSEKTFSRVVPDVAGWRRSTTGWPDRRVTPVTLVPDWVGEVLSPGTEAFDRGEKLGAYGSMGVGWVWLVDIEASRVETFANIRGRMEPRRIVEGGEAITGDPFGAEIPIAALFE